jgi:O-antigen/teichoic acid export membrane protein
MRRSLRLLINTTANICFYAIQFGAALVVVPLVLSYFGKNVFGIYATIVAISVLFSFLSAALSMSLMKFIPSYVKQRESGDLSAVLTTFSLCSALIYLSLGTCILMLPLLGWERLNVAPDLAPLTARVTRIMGFCLMLQFLQPIVSGILGGLERFVLRSIISVPVLLASPIAYIVTSRCNGDLDLYTLIVQLCSITSMVLGIFCCLWFLPCRWRWVLPSRALMKQLWGFNLFVVVNQMAHHIMNTTDVLILQRACGTATVSEYHVAQKSQHMSESVLGLPLRALLPSQAGAFAAHDYSFIRKLNYIGSITYSIMVVPPLVALLILIDVFIVLWVGPSFSNSVAGAALFIISAICASPLKIVAHSLIAKGDVKVLGWTRFVYAIANVILSVWLVRYWGIIGVIVPTVLFWILVNPICVIWLAQRHGLISGTELTKLLLPLPVILVFAALYHWLCHGWLAAESWSGFIASYSTTYVVILVLYCVIYSMVCPNILTEVASSVIGAFRSHTDG